MTQDAFFNDYSKKVGWNIQHTLLLMSSEYLDIKMESLHGCRKNQKQFFVVLPMACDTSGFGAADFALESSWSESGKKTHIGGALILDN